MQFELDRPGCDECGRERPLFLVMVPREALFLCERCKADRYRGVVQILRTGRRLCAVG